MSHASQGHPESGKSWERHIDKILTSEGLSFKHATHDRSTCSANVEGHEVPLLRQVDDFALATPNEELAKLICDRIGKKLQLPSEENVPFEYLGLLEDFDGSKILQVTPSKSRHWDPSHCHSYSANSCPVNLSLFQNPMQSTHPSLNQCMSRTPLRLHCKSRTPCTKPKAGQQQPAK